MRPVVVAGGFIFWVSWLLGFPGLGFVLVVSLLAVSLVLYRPPAAGPAPVSRPGRSRWYVGLTLPIGPFFASIIRRLGR